MSDELQEGISEGKLQWGGWVNPDYWDIVAERNIKDILHQNSRALQRETLRRCAGDIVFWLREWVWTVDPRNLDYGMPVSIPFVPFPKQEEYLRWRQQLRLQRQSGIIEKSRDAGITFLNCAAQLHAWLFEPGFKGSFGSRKEALVDRKGDPDAIFTKIRLMLEMLPVWMRPKRYTDSHMKLINLDNGASITGEAGDQIGRGGRSTYMDIDEAAFLERPLKVEAAISQNTNVVFYTSTPNGTGNPFYTKRMSGKFPVFSFHWTDDPRKDAVWYASMKDRLDPVTLAQEVDIDYTASMQGQLIQGKWVEASVNFFDPSEYYGGRYQAGLDVAGGGTCESVLTIMRGALVYPQITWKGVEPVPLADLAHEVCLEDNVKHLTVDANGIGDGTLGTLKRVRHRPYSVTGFLGSMSPSDLHWEEENLSSKQKFVNARAEGYFRLALRFRKTFERKTGLRWYPDEECISISRDSELIAQLTSIGAKRGVGGKIGVPSKADMAKAGVKSPDRADSLMYANCAPYESSSYYYPSTVQTEGYEDSQVIKNALRGLV